MNFDDVGNMDDIFNGIGGMYEDTDFFNDANSPVLDPLQENNGLDDMFSHADSSLTVPMREHYVTTDAPPLSPAMPHYQTMQTYDGIHGMSMENQINAQGYNSFEQPVQMINGDYTQPVEEPPMHRVETPQQHYYANERPSTSSHQQQQQKPVAYQQAQATPNSRPASTNVRNPPTTTRQRPIQPKGSNNSRKKAAEPAQNGASRVSVQLSAFDNQRVNELVTQMAALEAQSRAHGIDNSQTIQELQANLLAIFNRDGSLAQIGAAVEPPSQPPPRNSTHRPSRPQNHGIQQQQPQHGYEPQPSSPYQPQMMVVSQPSTSQGHVYQDYHQPPQHVVVHQNQQQQHLQPPQQKQLQPPQQQHPPRQQQPQPLYRVATVPASSVQMQVQGTYQQQQSQAVYVQQAPVQGGGSGQGGPTVGQFIRQQQHVQQVRLVKIQAPVVPPQPMNQMPQQQRIAPAPILTPQPPVFQAPPRQTAAQFERELEEKKAVRRKRIHDFMSSMDGEMEDAGTNRPFSDLGDVLKRLLPYHRYLERDLKQEHVDFLDANLLRANLNNNERVKYLKGRVHQLFLDESARDEIKEEQNLLLYLDMEYEKRKLEEEKSHVNDLNREEFVMRSPLLPALRGTSVSHPTPLPHPPKFVNHYEYYPFAEIPRPISPCKSPYLMSPSSSARSHSPLKSPTFQSPRLRVRSTNSTSSHEPSSSAGSPEKERRRKEERNGRIEIEPARKTRNLVPEKKVTAVEAVRVKTEPAESPRKAEIPAKKARESPKKTLQQPLLKEIKREPVEAAPETSTAAAAEVIVTKTKPPKAVAKFVKIKVKEEVVEPESLVPNCSDAAPAVKLPAKKAFLNRVRNAIPPALRSPPAQMAKPSNGVESDGSCSPELGLDDFSSVPSTPVDPAAPSMSRALDARNSLPSPLKKLVPLPPPLPTKKSSVKKSKITVDLLENRPQNKIRVKLGPPPTQTPVVAKETRSTRNSSVSEVKTDLVTPRRQRQEDQANLADVDTPATEVKRPPIKLKLKLGGHVMTVDGEKEAKDRNANLLKAKEKEEKRLRKEKRRRKREEHERKRAERLLAKEETAGTSSPRGEAVVVATEGLKLKIKFAQPRSRTVTPAIPIDPADLPSTSRSNGFASNHHHSSAAKENPPPVQIKKLRIRLGPAEPMIEMAVAPITRTTNGGGAAMPLPSAAAGSAQGALPAVDFSDQSDSDGERLRTAADETLRTWGGIGLNVQPAQPPLLPFSHP